MVQITASNRLYCLLYVVYYIVLVYTTRNTLHAAKANGRFQVDGIESLYRQ